jgi:hypothetical protein
MPFDSDTNIAAADALTLLLHNQHALAAAIEEVTVAANAVGAMETIDRNAEAMTRAITRLRQS